MKAFTAEHTPAEVVNIFPKASDLFKVHDINFCCQGNRPLQVVLEEKDLDKEALLTELNQRYAAWKDEGHEITDYGALSLTDIIDYVQEKYHTFLENELEPLEQFVTRVYHVHGGDHPHLIDLFNLYHDLLDVIETHLEKEEKEWFPLIKRYELEPQEELKERLQVILREMEAEHETEVDILNNIRNITNGFQPPAGACNTYRITYARLHELEENIIEHVHVENNVLLERIKESIGK